jgi:hypothetical protein
MRVRCSFCGAEYEAAVTRAALSLVGRCERCDDEPRVPDRPDAAA